MHTCTHIASQAFAGCVHLKKIVIPKNVFYIAKDAFEDCPELSIEAEEGSFAWNYALEHEIPLL